MAHGPEIRCLKSGALDFDFHRTQAAALRGAVMQDALNVKAAFRVAVTTMEIKAKPGPWAQAASSRCLPAWLTPPSPAKTR